jgi:Tfp pilus assembly protein PilN
MGTIDTFIPASARKWLAAGTGAGIEIGADGLRVSVVRVRPSGVRVLGAAAITQFRERPAAEWGGIYQDFLKRAGAGHLSANVLLPRREVIVRRLELPGISGRDLAAAIQLQIDSLHPYAEGEAEYAWARIGGGSVLVAIVHREVLERYITLFSEAGIRVASFSFSAAAVYPALRLTSTQPPASFLALRELDGGGVEAYGESEAKPLFSAEFDAPWDRAAVLAAAELRLGGEVAPVTFDRALPQPKTFPSDYDSAAYALSYAAALCGACPLLALPLNLLPARHRSTNSRAIFVPTAALAVILIAGLVALGSINPIEDRKYMAALQDEIARLEPVANRAAALDRAIDRARSRTRLLDGFRRRSRADLDALAELTRVLEPPAWLTSLEMSRDAVTLSGQAQQAAPLLKAIDSSPYFQASSFVSQITKQDKMEAFRIHSERREGRQ